MRRWAWAFLFGFVVYLGLSVILTSVVSAPAASGIGFLAGITVMIVKARSGRPSTDA